MNNRVIAKEFKEKLNANEWFFSDLRESLLKNKTNKDVFTEIDEVVDLIVEQKDKTLVYESFLLLVEMYRKVDTTERTENLNANWNVLKEHIFSYGDAYGQQFQDFERWFGSKWK